jgi:hypothetical protein
MEKSHIISEKKDLIVKAGHMQFYIQGVVADTRYNERWFESLAMLEKAIGQRISKKLLNKILDNIKFYY